jgi:hypothetical protein
VADPVRDDGKILALKYSGYCTDASSRIAGEYQIVSVLTGLFWNIEHSAIYKPLPQLKGVVQSLTMQERTKDLLEALNAFEEEFEPLVREGSFQEKQVPKAFLSRPPPFRGRLHICNSSFRSDLTFNCYLFILGMY